MSLGFHGCSEVVIKGLVEQTGGWYMRSDSSDDFEFVPKIANSTEEEISHARAANVAMTLEKAAQKHTGLSGIPEGTFDGLADEVVDAIYKRIIKANSPSVEDNVTPTPGR